MCPLIGDPSGREVRRFPRMSQRRPDIGFQHHSRGANRAPADWSSSRVALPVDSLADEPLGRRCSALFAFCCHTVVPRTLSSRGVWVNRVVHPIRQCLTHLLPVKPTGVGGTDLAARGVPKSVSLGELSTFSTSRTARRVDARRREPMLSAFRVSGLFSGVSAVLFPPPALFGSGEISRGPSATRRVTLGPPKSRGQTLRLSG